MGLKTATARKRREKGTADEWHEVRREKVPRTNGTVARCGGLKVACAICRNLLYDDRSRGVCIEFESLGN